MMSVWFITGCSSGFGAGLALLALRAGHKVVATSRTPSKTPEMVAQVEALGGTWLQLDVCSPTLPQVLDKAISINGHIDVLVNNAGYSLLGAVENISDNEARSQMETNFFAPLSIIRHILPTMRERKSGMIVNISSTAGFVALPTCGLYAASKHALEGLSEAMSHELAPFGIRILVVQPGGFNTSFINNYTTPAKPMLTDYIGTPVDAVLNGLPSMKGMQGGDPQKACRAIFDVVTGTGAAEGLKEQFLRLPLGSDCGNRFQGKINTLQRTLNELKPIWEGTDTGKECTMPAFNPHARN